MDKDKNSEKIKYSAKRVKSSEKTVKLESVRKKSRAKNKKNKTKSNVYYSFLTIILLICLVQLGFSAILNISKTIAYSSKVVQIQKIRNDAEKKNTKLKEEIKDFSTLTSLEAIARNNLKMAGEDEVLIIINNDEEEQNVQKKKKGKFFNNGSKQ